MISRGYKARRTGNPRLARHLNSASRRERETPAAIEHGRGENVARDRRTELRRVAQSEAEMRLKRAEASIAKASGEAQERVIAAGPELDFEAVEQIVAPDRTRPPAIDDDE